MISVVGLSFITLVKYKSSGLRQAPAKYPAKSEVLITRENTFHRKTYGLLLQSSGSFISAKTGFLETMRKPVEVSVRSTSSRERATMCTERLVALWTKRSENRNHPPSTSAA